MRKNLFGMVLVVYAASTLLFAITSSDTRENVPEIRIVMTKIVTTHLMFFLFSRFMASGSVFATRILLLRRNGLNIRTAADKINLTA